MRAPTIFLALAALATFFSPVLAADIVADTKPTTEFPSPNGQFAFRYTPVTADTGKAYDLIRQPTGEVVLQIARQDVEPGPSERFSFEVLWRSDSQAVAITETQWKRGSYVAVYRRDGATFKEVELPELLADFPAKVIQGKSFPHISELNSQKATEWRKDGSLVVRIENIQDGNEGSATANRTVTLGFPTKGPAKILKSAIKFKIEKSE